MANIPRIAESEWMVMKLLWEKSPLTAQEVIDRLAGTTTWKPKTVKTLLSRLLNKQAIGYDKKGRIYEYYPLVKEDECVREESFSFLERVYGGSFNAMLANFLEYRKPSREEIEELKKLLENSGD